MKALLTMTSLLFLFDVAAFATQLVPNKGSVSFTAIGKPGFLKIRGEAKDQPPKGTITVEKGKATGELTFNLDHLTTGIDLRDEHMKNKYLEVGKYPTAKLTLKSLDVTDEELKKDFKKDFKGTLTMREITKDVEGKIDYKASDKSVKAAFTIKVSDFNIPVPKYMGVTVSETVDVETKIVMK